MMSGTHPGPQVDAANASPNSCFRGGNAWTVTSTRAVTRDETCLRRSAASWLPSTTFLAPGRLCAMPLPKLSKLQNDTRWIVRKALLAGNVG